MYPEWRYIFYEKEGSNNSNDFLIKSNEIVSFVKNTKDEELRKEIYSLFGKEIDRNSKYRYYLISLLREVLKNDPSFVFESLRSDSFKKAKNEIQKTYVRNLFFVLAETYPEKFFECYTVIKDNWDIFGYAFEGFFERFIELDSEKAYTFLIDERILALTKEFSGTEFGYSRSDVKRESSLVLENIYDRRINILCRRIIEKRGFDSIWIVESELKRQRQDLQKKRILEALSRAITFDHLENAVVWSNEKLSIDDRDRFVQALFDELLLTTNDWQKLLEAGNLIGMDKLSDKNIDQLSIMIAREDPLAAIDFIANTTGIVGRKKEIALGSVVVFVLDNYSSDKTLPIIDSLSDGQLKNVILPRFFQKYYTENPKEAVEWIAKKSYWVLLDDAFKIEIHRDKEAAKNLVLNVLNNYPNEENAFNATLGFWHLANASETGIEVINELDGDVKQKYTEGFYSTWLKIAPSNAAKSLLSGEYSYEQKLEILNENIKMIPYAKSIADIFSSINDESILQDIARNYVVTVNDLRLKELFAQNIDEKAREILIAEIKEKKNDSQWTPEELNKIRTQTPPNNPSSLPFLSPRRMPAR